MENEITIAKSIPLMINGETYVYFMTNDYSLIIEKLEMFGFRQPNKEDFFVDEKLPKNVRTKMIKLCKTYNCDFIASLTVSVGIEFSEISFYFQKFDEVVTVLLNDLLPEGESSKIDKLYSYIADNKTTEIENLIKTGFDLEQVIQQGATPLIGAAVLNSYKSAKTLLQLGANINAKDVDGFTPLMYAIARNSTETVELIIADKNIDLEASDINGNTALHYAAIHNNKTIIKMLIDTGTNLNAINNLGKTALHISIEANFEEVAELLIDSHANLEIIDKTYQTPLLSAISKDNVRLAKKLMEAGCHIDIEQPVFNAELLYAVMFNSTKFLEYYFATQSVPKLALATTYNKAIDYNSIDSISTILKCSEEKSDLATCLLFDVCEKKTLELLPLCFKYNCNVNGTGGYGVTPLMISCFSFGGTEELVQILIDKGADLDLTDSYGMTALMYAASKNNVKIIQLLLENGADRTIEDNQRNTYELYLKEIDYRTYEELSKARLKELIAKGEVNNEDSVKDDLPDDCQSFDERFWYYRNRFFKLNQDAKDKDSAIYNPVGLSKQTYGKIKNNKCKHHDKETLILLAFGLRLSVKEAEYLLQSAGYTFNKRDKVELEIKKLLMEKKYKSSDWTENVADRIGKDK